jgi:DMSO reductase anchor subunit
VVQDELRVDYRELAAEFLPATPNPAITIPTTRFVSKHPLPESVVSTISEPRVQPAHLPLVFMLVLTQMGVGAMLIVPFLSRIPATGLRLLSLAATFAGVGASVLHLGQPRKAWRSFLGWRTSWLSREILCFGVFPALSLIPLLTPIAAVCGAGSVFCSAMIYHQTRRPFWHLKFTAWKFFGTALVLGLASAWFVSSIFADGPAWIPIVLGLVLMLKFSLESISIKRADLPIAEAHAAPPGQNDMWLLAQAAVRMKGRFGLATRSRFLLLIGSMILSFTSPFFAAGGLPLSAITLILCLGGEFLERFLFFRAVVAPAMP